MEMTFLTYLLLLAIQFRENVPFLQSYITHYHTCNLNKVIQDGMTFLAQRND